MNKFLGTLLLACVGIVGACESDEVSDIVEYDDGVIVVEFKNLAAIEFHCGHSTELTVDFLECREVAIQSALEFNPGDVCRKPRANPCRIYLQNGVVHFKP